jgi:glyoxylase-like metal-dependent hydrolase (beta-lactamase superfamily II)
MSGQFYAFKVGDIDCRVLLDGMTVIGAEGIAGRFPSVPEADAQRAFREVGQSIDDAASSLNILLARIGGETVLFDAGEGGRPKGGGVIPSLRLASIAPEEVTLVVITHTHGDHILGLVDANGQPVYPNARYVISAPERAFWQARIAAQIPEQQGLMDMIEERGVRVIAADEPIMPGLTAVPIPGHTPGQIASLIESGGEKLIHLADLLHSPMQFAYPEWSPRFDADPTISVPTRQELLQRAADENMLAFFYHLPFPGLGRVSRADRGFAWEPV